jgi:hypothetical protein
VRSRELGMGGLLDRQSGTAPLRHKQRNRRTARRVAAHLSDNPAAQYRFEHRGDAAGEKGARHHSEGKPRVLGVPKVKARADAAEKSGNCGRQDKPELIWSEVRQVARLWGPGERASLFGWGERGGWCRRVASRLICAGRDRMTGCAS